MNEHTRLSIRIAALEEALSVVLARVREMACEAGALLSQDLGDQTEARHALATALESAEYDVAEAELILHRGDVECDC